MNISRLIRLIKTNMTVRNHIFQHTKHLKLWIFATAAVLVSVMIILMVNRTTAVQSIVSFGGALTETVTEKVGGIFTPGNSGDEQEAFAAVPVSAFAGTPGVAGCGITLAMASDKGTVAVGENTSYTLTVKNEGKKVCNGASVTAYYSGNQSFTSSTPKPSSSNYYWSFGKLDVGASKTVTVTVSQTPGDTVPFMETEACATANNGQDACTTLRINIGGTAVAEPDEPEDEVEPFNPAGKEYGTWVWTSPNAMTATYMNKVISGAKANKINVIYVTIDDYLSIHNLAAGATKDAKKAKYSDALERFIVAANKEGIAVDVEAGWRDWAEAGNTWKSNVILDYAMEYNATRAAKIRGVQFDIEPYLMPTYEKNKAPLLTNFVALVDASTKRLGSNSLKLTFVIPHFYDSAQEWTPAVSNNGIAAHTFDHMMRILDARPGSSIILMSYRNFAEGDDSTIQISQVEVDQAAGRSTKVIVAQETGDVDPHYVTFYGLSRAEYDAQIALINQAFGGKSGFGGIAVHYIDPFLQLK